MPLYHVYVFLSDANNLMRVVENERRVGRSCASKTNENISKINDIFRKDRHLSIEMIVDMMFMSTIRQLGNFEK